MKMLKCIVLLLWVQLVLGAPGIDLRTPNARIVGGHDADIADYPYQAALLNRDGYFCGGVIISTTKVLTAAYCVSGIDITSLRIRVGSSVTDGGGQLLEVKKIISHPEYVLLDYNIAILELSAEITATNSSPIPLPHSGTDIPSGAIATITGWGSVNENGDSPKVLQVIQVPVVSDKDCTTAYGSLYTERMLCAGLFLEGGKDACQRDSGGPLVIGGILAGLVSFGNGCGRAQYPGVYTKVPAFRDWIKENADV